VVLVLEHATAQIACYARIENMGAVTVRHDVNVKDFGLPHVLCPSAVIPKLGAVQPSKGSRVDLLVLRIRSTIQHRFVSVTNEHRSCGEGA
jgi:hypothetical protein